MVLKKFIRKVSTTQCTSSHESNAERAATVLVLQLQCVRKLYLTCFTITKARKRNSTAVIVTFHHLRFIYILQSVTMQLPVNRTSTFTLSWTRFCSDATPYPHETRNCERILRFGRRGSLVISQCDGGWAAYTRCGYNTLCGRVSLYSCNSRC